IGELLAPAAYFPDSLVGIGPDRLEMVEQRALDPPSPLVLAQAAESRLIERVHELAVDIELQLGVRRVADADGAGTLIAGQPRYLPLRQPPLAGDGIHDLKLVGTAGNRAKEPITPCPRLVVIPCSHQRKQGQRSVANPAEAIVPVPGAADLFGQRSRGGRDDAPAGPKRQRLQGNERAQDMARIRPGRLASAGPIPPEPIAVFQQMIRIRCWRSSLVGNVMRQYKAFP